MRPLIVILLPAVLAAAFAHRPLPRCAADDGGIDLARGLCAVVVADQRARHIAIAPNGDLFLAVDGSQREPGGVVALRDRDGDGRAETARRFGPGGGSGIVLRGGYLYFAPNDAVLRWKLAPGQLEPGGPPDTIVQGLPTGGDHGAKTIAVDDHGNLFVNVGSSTNSCQRANRMVQSPGADPCKELETRAGIWSFHADRQHQTQRDGTRFATGIRNAVAITIDPQGRLWAVQHGRDQLFQNWPGLYDARQGAELPGEELIQVNRGDDFGWPYCYYDGAKHRLVLAPEYGGDGVKAGRCAQKKAPVYGFPGHWAPEAIVFASGSSLPGYGAGAFISFHGSWNRGPEPEAAGRVVFLPLDHDRAGTPVTVAQGFGGTGGAAPSRYKPMGLALGPDGSLYIGSDQAGRIWRIIPRPASP